MDRLDDLAVPVYPDDFAGCFFIPAAGFRADTITVSAIISAAPVACFVFDPIAFFILSKPVRLYQMVQEAKDSSSFIPFFVFRVRMCDFDRFADRRRAGNYFGDILSARGFSAGRAVDIAGSDSVPDFDPERSCL